VAYPFVQAANDYGPMPAGARALIVHMAEGGGTVGFLAHENTRGVSVHFVIEYSGRIVQMLKLDHAAGSINPRDIRTTDDPDGFYGATAAAAVMRDYHQNPNAASWSVEIEGFAKDGPNAAQGDALVALVLDLDGRASIGLLGHRDFADYKPCPGKLIPWAHLGGHGINGDAPGTGGDMRFVNANGATVSTTRRLSVSAGSAWSYLDGSAGGKMPATTTLPWVGKGDSDATEHVVLLATGTPYPDGVQRPTLVLVRSTNSPVDIVPPGPVVDCDDVVTTELDAAAIRAADAVKNRGA
jgi:hypothetical protein